MNKELYAHRKASGLCVVCGCTLPDGWESVRCDRCIARMSDNNKKRRQAQREEDKVILVKKPKKKKSVSLDEATLDARNMGMSYAEMQKAEILKKLRGD